MSLEERLLNELELPNETDAERQKFQWYVSQIIAITEKFLREKQFKNIDPNCTCNLCDNKRNRNATIISLLDMLRLEDDLSNNPKEEGKI